MSQNGSPVIEEPNKNTHSMVGGVQYSNAVQQAIDELMPSTDALYKADFDVTSYINGLFPTEQSLSQLDEVMMDVTQQMSDLDSEIADLVHTQSSVGQDGRVALQEAKTAIQELFTRVREIKAKTDMSETMVKEITRDIKQLDVAKKNLTGSIATLHHLHILLNGVNGLGDWIEKREYDRVAAELPAIQNVLMLFEPYMQIEQVKQLATQVDELQTRLSEQVVADFKTAFSMQTNKRTQVYEMCRVVSVLHPSLKTELCNWYIQQQLKEYALLFDDTEDCAWIDKIEQRYRWIVAKLTDFEQRGLAVLFPPDWDMMKRIAAEWCYMTRNMLERVISKRRAQLDARLLAHAVQVTTKFEALLAKRFPPKMLEDGSAPPPNEFVPKPTPVPDTFEHIVRCVYEKYMDVFIAQQDKNLDDFVNQCVTRFRQGEDRPSVESSTTALPLASSSRLFLYYKRAIIEAHDMSTNPLQLQLQLAVILKKYLREYAVRCLLAILVRSSAQSTGQASTASAMLNAAAGTSALFQSFLPPASVAAPQSSNNNNEPVRLCAQDQLITCCVLATADWCAETTHQLQEKLNQKSTDVQQQAKFDMSQEQEQFYNISSHALSILAQDLEAACDAPLTAMTKINWATFDAVGDESGFIRAICQHLKTDVPQLREYLAERRKYFGHLCLKFAQQLVTKYINCLFRCKPCGVTGAEQLLLDTHALKTFLMTLPQVGSSVAPKPPTAYIKVITKGMTKAEMLLKVVMSPIDSPSAFIDQYRKLLPESDANELQKVLEMKAVRRTEQAPIIDRYRTVTDAYVNTLHPTLGGAAPEPVLSLPRVSSQQQIDRDNPSQPLMSLTFDTDSRIKKLEKLVKKKL